MKKRIFGLFVLVLSLCSLTGCGNAKTDNNIGNNNSEKIKGNCTAVECIQQIKVENTVEEINKIIGITGELTDEKRNEYYWEISENTGITVTYNSSTKGNIKIDANRDIFKNSKVDLSQLDTLKVRINDGLTYDQVKSYLGNVDGVLTEKGTVTNKYTWVNNNGGYVNVSFSATSGKCTSMFGIAK